MCFVVNPFEHEQHETTIEWFRKKLIIRERDISQPESLNADLQHHKKFIDYSPCREPAEHPASYEFGCDDVPATAKQK